MDCSFRQKSTIFCHTLHFNGHLTLVSQLPRLILRLFHLYLNCAAFITQLFLGLKAKICGLGLATASPCLALEGRPWHKSSRPLIWLIPVFFLPNATNFLSLSLLSVSETKTSFFNVRYIKSFNEGKEVAHWWVLCLHYKLYSFCLALTLALMPWPWPWGMRHWCLGLGLDGVGLVNITDCQGCASRDLVLISRPIKTTFWGLGLGLGLPGLGLGLSGLGLGLGLGGWSWARPEVMCNRNVTCIESRN